MNTTSKTALITGASSGIGRELAYVYARNNYNLILTARRKVLLEETKHEIEKEYPVSVKNIEMDLSEAESPEKLYKAVTDNKINVLINNAGVGVYGDFEKIDVYQEEKMLILNIISLTKLTRLFANDDGKSRRRQHREYCLYSCLSARTTNGILCRIKSLCAELFGSNCLRVEKIQC